MQNLEYSIFFVRFLTSKVQLRAALGGYSTAKMGFKEDFHQEDEEAGEICVEG